MYPLKSLQDLITARLEKEAGLIGAADPFNLYHPIKYALSMGGKRLRPVMVLQACDLFGGKIEDAINPALAIEIFHNFTLLHDDIMDKAGVRRNKPTVHQKYNENIAILSGDAMSIMAYRYLLETNSPARHELVKLFTETAIEVCEGQQYDMDFEERMDVSITDYMKMIRLKTAVLIACSLKTGALIGNASAADAGHIYNFGINLGLAFQLQDDLLDVFADQNKFGKKIGGDIVANKKTFLLLKTLELATPEQREQLMYWISRKACNQEEKIRAVKQIYTGIKVREITEEIMERLYRQAVSEMEAVSVEQERKKEILLLSEKMIKREK